MELRITLTDQLDRTLRGPCLVHEVGPAGELAVYGGADGCRPLLMFAPGAWVSVEVTDEPASGAPRQRWLSRHQALGFPPPD